MVQQSRIVFLCMSDWIRDETKCMCFIFLLEHHHQMCHHIYHQYHCHDQYCTDISITDRFIHRFKMLLQYHVKIIREVLILCFFFLIILNNYNSTISAKNYSKNSSISKSCTTTSNTSTCTTNHNLNYIYHGAQHPINVHNTLSVSTSFTSLQGASTYYWIILLLFAGIGTQIEMWGVFMTEVQTTVSICIMYLKHLHFVVLVKCYNKESIISV